MRVHKALFHLFQFGYSKGYCSAFHSKDDAIALSRINLELNHKFRPPLLMNRFRVGSTFYLRQGTRNVSTRSSARHLAPPFSYRRFVSRQSRRLHQKSFAEGNPALICSTQVGKFGQRLRWIFADDDNDTRSRTTIINRTTTTFER